MGDEKNLSLMDIILERLPFIGKAEKIDFHSHGFLTLGVEVELQIIDPETLNLVSRATPLLKAGGHIKGLKAEIYQSMVEVSTAKCNSVQEIENDLTESFQALQELGQKQDILFATTGCHPYSRYADNLVTHSPRYHELIDRNQWISRRITIFSMHVHMGMKSGEEFIRFNNFFLHFMPHLLALSASSPFWQGEDTGLISCRPCIFESLPTAGQPYQVHDWHEFESLYHTLRKCHSIHSLKDLWWDMRPNPAFGTLEIRICDGPASLAEASAIVAYIHLLAHWFSDNGGWIDHVPPPPRWLARENKWRAMRYGLDADLVINTQGETKPIRKDIEEWLHKTAKYRDSLDYGKYIQALRQILAHGNSSHRQRRIYEETGSLQSVVKHNIMEFEAHLPLWERNSHDHEQPQPLLTEIVPVAG
jgi:glutamate---cysteine ligase / carboxylate-amine ligase